MKKLIAFLTVVGILTFGISNFAYSQDGETTANVEQTDEAATPDTAVTEPDSTVVEAVEEEVIAEEEVVVEQTFHQVLKEKFIEGGAGFMAIVLVCLILGLGIAIERIIYLNMSTTNTEVLLTQVEEALNNGGVDKAKAICKDTRGPVAGIFFQGLDRMDDGVEAVEKTIIAYGGVLTGRLEKGLSWLSLFISLAPMLGFMGTVIGMIGAFDAIQAAGDISPTVVAGGIKVALLTTVFGLIVAIILQIFYNYIISKIDSIVNTMEDTTISFVDLLVKKSK